MSGKQTAEETHTNHQPHIVPISMLNSWNEKISKDQQMFEETSSTEGKDQVISDFRRKRDFKTNY